MNLFESYSRISEKYWLVKDKLQKPEYPHNSIPEKVLHLLVEQLKCWYSQDQQSYNLGLFGEIFLHPSKMPHLWRCQEAAAHSTAKDFELLLDHLPSVNSEIWQQLSIKYQQRTQPVLYELGRTIGLWQDPISQYKKGEVDTTQAIELAESMPKPFKLRFEYLPEHLRCKSS